MEASMKSIMPDILQEFSQHSSKAEEFLSVQTKSFGHFKNITKKVYDFCKEQSGNQSAVDPSLPELIIDNFDEEQIWQQLELQNNNVVSDLLSKISGIVTHSDKLEFKTRTEESSSSKHVSFTKNDDNESEEDDTDIEMEHIRSRMGHDNVKHDESDSSNSDTVTFKGNNVLDIESDNDSDTDLDLRIPDLNQSDDSDSSDHLAEKKKGKKKKPEKKNKSIVDDRFFKLADMEAFLDQEDAKEERRMRGGDSESDDEDIDMFADIPSDSEEDESGRRVKYEDFFDPPEDEKERLSKRASKEASDVRKQFEEEIDDDDDEMSHGDEESGEDEEQTENTHSHGGSNKKDLLDSSEGEDVDEVLGGASQEKSSFEKQQEKLKERIAKMEDASLKEKPWQLSGEISALSRPENSLLEEHLIYDQTVKLAPVITEETTQSLESIIKQRIKDKAFDDVERKVKPKDNPFEYKKRIVLDQEKSKLSLGEVYEQEFLKQQKEEEEEKADPQHEEIKSMMQSLFIKLDALSNFHYTPKPAASEVKIVTNLPSIAMEEVAPVTHGAGTLLAPEEIKDKSRKELKGKTEQTSTDKKSLLRSKKTEKRRRQRERQQRQKLIEKMNPGLGNKYSKEKALKSLEKDSQMGKGITMIKEDKQAAKQKLTSSKSFFSQLQEDAQSIIKKRKLDTTKKSVKKSAKKFKL